MRSLHAAILVTVILTGCAGHGHRDRSYDPCYSCGETLFDQVRISR
jgi:hypothetical protein